MKMPRNILRKIELKIYHAMTLEQIKKGPLTETQSKLGISKTNGEEAAVSK
jgi:hypothetical protein